MIFQGYRRKDGTAGARNLVLVIPSVGCSQGAAQAIARGLKGVVCLPNILGCGQMGEDRGIVRRTLAGFGTNPNVFSVLVVGTDARKMPHRSSKRRSPAPAKGLKRLLSRKREARGKRSSKGGR